MCKHWGPHTKVLLFVLFHAWCTCTAVCVCMKIYIGCEVLIYVQVGYFYKPLQHFLFPVHMKRNMTCPLQ